MTIRSLLILAGLALTGSAHAALLGEPLTSTLATLLPNGPQKFLLHLEADGPRVGWGADGAPLYRLNGEIHAGSAVDANADVGPGYGAHVGRIVDWYLSVAVGGDASGYRNTDTRLRCAPCRIALDDGGVLEAIVDNRATPWPELDIPLDARLLPELGPVSNSDALRPAHIRSVGCIGLRETTGRGKLAGASGTLCLNGVVKLPSWPGNAAAVGAQASLGLESDSTLTMHRPLADAITIK